MASVTGQSDVDNMASVAVPPEILQRIFGFLQDPEDLASCHMVNTRFCAAARLELTSAEPRDRGFFELALLHHYPLRRLSTTVLPFCNQLGSYLAKAPASLTSLRVTRKTLCAPETGREHFGQLPMADVLQGIRSLRSLSCPVMHGDRNFDFLRLPHLNGLHTLFLDLGPTIHDYKGLSQLTGLKHLVLLPSFQSGRVHPELLTVIGGLTNLQALHLRALADASPLSALSRLTALRLGLRREYREDSCSSDAHLQRLVEALPQLRALDLLEFGKLATEAGFRQFSKLTKLQHLRLVNSFAYGAQYSLDSGVVSLTGLEALSISCSAFFTSGRTLAGLSRLTKLTALEVNLSKASTESAIDAMLVALGPRLRRLRIQDMDYQCSGHPSVLPAIRTHCPLLTSLEVEVLRPTDAEAVSFPEGSSLNSAVPLAHCSQLRLRCGLPEAELAMPWFRNLRRLSLQVDSTSGDEDYREAKVIKGLQCLAHLQYVNVQLDTVGRSGALLRLFEALAACSSLTWLEVADGRSDGQLVWETPGPPEVGMGHLRSLTALPQLKVLNLYHTRWEEDPNCTGLISLLAGLPRLRVLNAPKVVLANFKMYQEILDVLPGRRLRQYPRRVTLGDAPPAHPAGDEDDFLEPDRWPALEPHRWLWDG